MASSLDIAKTYTSFAGVDIKVIVNNHLAGSMQAISYAIQREKAPIYVMGTVDPISFSRGKRGIAGTMISLMMNSHMLYSDSFIAEKAYLDKNEVFGEYIDRDTATPRANADINNAQDSGALLRTTQLGATRSVPISVSGNVAALGTPGGDTGAATTVDFGGGLFDSTDLSKNYAWTKVFYVDQILPFDVVIHAANEYGNTAQMRLFGCEILNEGSGFSIDDIVIENQMTYVCRTLLPWSPISKEVTKDTATYGTQVNRKP